MEHSDLKMSTVKKILVKILVKMGIVKIILESFLNFEAMLAKAWVSNVHKRLLFVQWGLPPSPEWFDHTIDLYYQWPKTKNSLWLERGVFGSLALKGKNVLELACGDGFNAKNFYSHLSEKIVACDFDKSAIKTAKNKNRAKNIEYKLADIRHEMPEGTFENVVWDAAIEHFTPEEIENILKNIKVRLHKNGVLSGYTLVEKGDGSKHIHQHEYEFKDKEDLRSFFTPHFKNVRVFETKFPSRHNLYFCASNSEIPFGPNWEKSC